MKVDAAKIKTLWLSAAVVLAVLLALALIVANTVLGPLNLDEGWYLLAARNFAAGARPYRDFFFTQGPALPFVYSSLAGIWSQSSPLSGLLGGRVVTFLLGSSSPVMTNGKLFTEVFWLKATDMFIYTTVILIIGCFAGVIVSRFRS